ncbi:MAG TPA: glycosyltransferase family 2 protein [Candidatus Paceibacterota bacterium]|nr:glycosyltransferase family 2 protein [Candidatus Paceibacterota bacterium]
MVYILIPVHNRKLMTLTCLEAISTQTYHQIKVTVIDDGSIDGTSESIQKKFPDVNLIRGDGTWWWGGAMNKGLASVLPQMEDEDFVLLLNDDTKFNNQYIEYLVHASTSNNRALVGSLARNLHNPANVKDGGIRIDWEKFIFNKEYREGPHIIAVDALSGRGMLVPAEVFRKIGDFGTLFPQVASDLNFSLRAKRAGFNLVMSYDAVILSDDVLEKIKRPFFWRYFNRKSNDNIRSRLLIAWLHAPSLRLKIKDTFIICWRCFRYALTA